MDAHFQTAIIHIDSYVEKTMSKNYEFIKACDKEFATSNDIKVLEATNDKIASMMEEETSKVLDKVLYDASNHMKNSFSRSDN